MNATTIHQQKLRLKATTGNGRVPYLPMINQKYHNAVINVGKSSFVEKFEAQETPKGLILKVWLRPAEQFNLVVNAKLKACFEDHPKTMFPVHFEKQPFNILIPAT
jgi:hypothetical protein